MWFKLVSLSNKTKWKSPELGEFNVITSSVFCGEVKTEGNNIIKNSVLMGITLDGLRKMAPGYGFNTKKLWQVSRLGERIKDFLYKDHLSQNSLSPYTNGQRIVIGENSTIENCIIIGDTVIGDNVTLRDAIIINGKIANNVVIDDATVEDSWVGEDSLIKTSYVKGIIGKKANIDRATLEDVVVEDESIVKIAYVQGYHIGKNVRISEHSSLIKGPGADVDGGLIPDDSVINNCDLFNVKFIARNERQRTRIIMDHCSLKKANIVGGSSMRDYNNDLSGSGLSELSIQHKRLLEFFARFSKDEIDEWYLDFRSANEIEEILLTLLLGYKLLPEDINKSSNHPGLFSLEEIDGEYEQIIKDIDKYSEKLRLSIKDPEFQQEFKVFVDALLKLRLRSEHVGLLLIDVLSIQEIKGIIHKMFRMYSAQQAKDDRIHLEKVDATLGKVLVPFFYNHRLSVEDRIALSVGANGFDLATDNIARFMNLLNIDDPNVLIDLFVKGRVRMDTVKNFPGFDKVSSFLATQDSVYYTAGATLTEGIKTSSLSDFDKELWSTFELFSRNSTRSLRNRLGAKVEELAEKIKNTERLVYFFDNLGEMRFDFELLRAIIGERKGSNKSLQILLVGRSEKVENDVDTEYLSEKAKELMEFAPENVSVTVADSHSSSLLGHDKRFFDPSLMQNLKGSLIIAKGLGNMLTMHNVPQQIYFLLTLKGFMGQRLAKVLGTREEHAIYLKPNTSEFRDKYRDFYGIKAAAATEDINKPAEVIVK